MHRAQLARVTERLEELEEVARSLVERYRVAFLVKGGHLGGTEATDVLVFGDQVTRYSAPFQTGLSTHGTGCTLSAAVTANLAFGKSMEEAIRAGKAYISRAIADSLVWKGSAGEVTALRHW